MKYIIANIVLSLLPPTRFFGLKRFLLNILGIRIGRGTRVCGDVRFYGGGRVSIGDACWIGIGSKFYTSEGANVTVGDNCDVAPAVQFMCGSHEVGDHSRRAGFGYSLPITVDNGTWLGIGTIVLGGSQIGPGTIVGAGSLVLGRKYPGNEVLGGLPAKQLKELPTEGS